MQKSNSKTQKFIFVLLALGLTVSGLLEFTLLLTRAGAKGAFLWAFILPFSCVLPTVEYLIRKKGVEVLTIFHGSAILVVAMLLLNRVVFI